MKRSTLVFACIAALLLAADAAYMNAYATFDGSGPTVNLNIPTDTINACDVYNVGGYNFYVINATCSDIGGPMITFCGEANGGADPTCTYVTAGTCNTVGNSSLTWGYTYFSNGVFFQLGGYTYANIDLQCNEGTPATVLSPYTTPLTPTTPPTAPIHVISEGPSASPSGGVPSGSPNDATELASGALFLVATIIALLV